jgi:hypothetical protein
MKLQLTDYVPSLRWRQAEYQSLLIMPDQKKERIAPLITIPPIEYDFELQAPKKTAHEHIHPFALRLIKKWGDRPCWVDVHPTLQEARMDDGRISYDFVFDGLRESSARAVPVVSSDMSPGTLKTIAQIVQQDQQGIGLRLTLLDLMHPQKHHNASVLIDSVGCNLEEADLLLDIGAPKYEPIEVFADALAAQIQSFPTLSAFRNFALIGTGIPESFADVPQGGSLLPRNHWLLYRRLIQILPAGNRVPVFGDFAITHPDFVAFDMRLVKPAAKILYATDNAWLVRKGSAFRDNPAQMRAHCKAIVDEDCFRGASYSSGDAYISQCAAGAVGHSNLTRWKGIGINHHMTVVLDDLANLHAGG